MAPARQALSARADFSCDYRGHCHRQFTTTQQPCRLQARIEAPTRTARSAAQQPNLRRLCTFCSADYRPAVHSGRRRRYNPKHLRKARQPVARYIQQAA